MVKYLSPAYLRIGGNLADKLVFNSSLRDADNEIKKFYREYSYYTNFFDLHSLPNYVMTGESHIDIFLS